MLELNKRDRDWGSPPSRLPLFPQDLSGSQRLGNGNLACLATIDAMLALASTSDTFFVLKDRSAPEVD
jgi:hypothetical protein